MVVKSRTFRPQFVIGADGWDSTVRRLAGIGTETKGTAQIVSVYEADVTGDLPDEGRMVLDASRTSVFTCGSTMRTSDASGTASPLQSGQP